MEIRLTSSWEQELQYAIGDVTRVLLVTSDGGRRRGLADRATAILLPRDVSLIADVTPNPTINDIRSFQRRVVHKPDVIVAIGGGSVIDTAKVISILSRFEREADVMDLFSPSQFELAQDNLISLIAIPTTAGTGAEVTPFATIWDPAVGVKRSVESALIRPDTAIIDHTLIRSANDEALIFPALDTVSHLVESLWSGKGTATSYTHSITGLTFAAQGIVSLLSQRRNVDTQSLALASVSGGLAIAETRSSIAHSISYPLTVNYGVPHGLACSFALRALWNKMKSNFPSASVEHERIQEILSLISEFDLAARVARFATQDDILQLVPQMLTRGRADNCLVTFTTDEIEDVVADSLKRG